MCIYNFIYSIIMKLYKLYKKKIKGKKLNVNNDTSLLYVRNTKIIN